MGIFRTIFAAFYIYRHLIIPFLLIWWLASNVLFGKEDGPKLRPVGLFKAEAKAEPDFQITGDPANPDSYLEQLPISFKSHGPIMSREGGDPVFIADVFDGYAVPDYNVRPERVVGYASPQPCTLTPPNSGDYVAYVDISKVEAKIGLFANQSGMTPRLFPWYTRGRPKRIPPDAFDYRDVVVTYTDAPVHLVLASSANFSIWNLHLADGVEIARISTLNSFHAFANLPAGVQIERVSRYLSGGACDFGIAYPSNSDPYADWDRSGNWANEFTTAEELRERYKKLVWDYRNWFSVHFGNDALDRRAGWTNAPAVLIGPMPDAPIEYMPISETTLSVPDTRTIYDGPSILYEILFEARENQ